MSGDELRKEIERRADEVGERFSFKPLLSRVVGPYRIRRCRCGNAHISGPSCVRCEIEEETKRRRAR